MKKRSTRIFIRLALIVALSTAGYLGGTATVTPPSLANTTEEEDECENDRCQAVHGSIFVLAACVDAPNSDSGCDAKRVWIIGTHYCRTYAC